MGKFGGKVLTIFIASDGVRVCEGENRNGNPDLSKFFTVSGVESYFTIIDGRPPEISNMAGLVAAITEECKNRHVTTRKIMVVSNCFGIITEVERGKHAIGWKGILTGDIKDAIAAVASKSDKPAPGIFRCTRDWGSVPIKGRLEHVSTKSDAEMYLLKSLVQEFYKNGYEVLYISGSREVLLNFKQTESASFDSQGKLIIDVDQDICISAFVKDTLYSIDHYSIIDPNDIVERLITLAGQSLNVTGRSPKVYLSGPFFRNTVLYNQVCDAFEMSHYSVYDLFNRPEVPDNYEELCAIGEIQRVITPDFSANLALLMCNYAKVLINLTPTVAASDLFKKNSKASAALFVGVSAALFIASGAWGVHTALQIKEMNENPSYADDYQSQVIVLGARQQSLQNTINTLTKADTTVLDLLSFIDDTEDENIRIVSVDTADMLRNEYSVSDSLYDGDEFVEGSEGGPSPEQVRESIIVRGYSRSGTAAIAYFDKLFKADLPVDPILKGIERYTLPIGDEIYIFEIEVGGVG